MDVMAMAVPVQPISYVLPAPSVANLQQTNTVIINYTYDALSRLTTADYDSGDYFHYTYDAVGNRLTQDTLAGTNTYTYDIANRLTSADVPWHFSAYRPTLEWREAPSTSLETLLQAQSIAKTNGLKRIHLGNVGITI